MPKSNIQDKMVFFQCFHLVLFETVFLNNYVFRPNLQPVMQYVTNGQLCQRCGLTSGLPSWLKSTINGSTFQPSVKCVVGAGITVNIVKTVSLHVLSHHTTISGFNNIFFLRHTKIYAPFSKTKTVWESRHIPRGICVVNTRLFWSKGHFFSCEKRPQNSRLLIIILL